MAVRDPSRKFDGVLSPRTEKVAKIVSLVGTPPFLSIPVFLLICLYQTYDTGEFLKFFGISFFAATVLPIVNIMYFSRRTGNEDKLDVVNKDDRLMPLVCGVLGYMLGTALLYYFQAPKLATVLMFCYMMVTFVFMLITPYWKISVHSCGVIGPSMAMTYAFWPFGALYFILLFPVAWSRYVLRKHTPLQLVMGAMVGYMITAVIFSAFLWNSGPLVVMPNLVLDCTFWFSML